MNKTCYQENHPQSLWLLMKKRFLFLRKDGWKDKQPVRSVAQLLLKDGPAAELQLELRGDLIVILKLLKLIGN